MSDEKSQSEETQDSLGDKLGLLLAMAMDFNADLWGVRGAEVRTQLLNEIKPAINYVKSYIPGFFSPFNSKKEFALVGLSPFGAPIVFGLSTGISLLGSAGGILNSVLKLALYGFAKNDKEERMTNLGVAAAATASCLIASIIAATLTTVSAFLALAYFITRSGATLVSMCSADNKPEHVGNKL